MGGRVFWEVGVLVALGALGAFAVLSISSRAAAPRNELARVAESLGLEATPRGLEGELDGVAVLAEPPQRDRGWRARVSLAMPWPDGVHLSSEEGQGHPLSVDDELLVCVEGPWPDLNRLLGDPAVSEPLAQALRTAVRVEIGDAVRVLVDSDGPWGAETAVRAGLALARGLNAVMAELQREAESTAAGLEVGAIRPGEGAWELPISADLPPVLPPRTELRSAHAGWGTDQTVGDVVLDAALHIRTADSEALRATISRDGVRERLIALIGEHRASVVRTGRLEVVVTDGALDPAARVAEIQALLAELEP